MSHRRARRWVKLATICLTRLRLPLSQPTTISSINNIRPIIILCITNIRLQRVRRNVWKCVPFNNLSLSRLPLAQSRLQHTSSILCASLLRDDDDGDATWDCDAEIKASSDRLWILVIVIRRVSAHSKTGIGRRRCRSRLQRRPTFGILPIINNANKCRWRKISIVESKSATNGRSVGRSTSSNKLAKSARVHCSIVVQKFAIRLITFPPMVIFASSVSTSPPRLRLCVYCKPKLQCSSSSSHHHEYNMPVKETSVLAFNSNFMRLQS